MRRLLRIIAPALARRDTLRPRDQTQALLPPHLQPVKQKATGKGTPFLFPGSATDLGAPGSGVLRSARHPSLGLTTMNLTTIRARVHRLRELALGMGKEVTIWQADDGSLLPLERKQYLDAV